jgi:hypothetical protein
MQDEYTNYAAGDVLPQTLEAFRNRACTLPYSHPHYEPPSTEEVGQLIKLAGWSQNDCAKITGVSYNDKKGSSTVRRWKTSSPNNHRDIPYSAWRLLLLHADIVTVDDANKELSFYKNLR